MPNAPDSILGTAEPARRADKPLSPDEAARAEQVARRLQDELRQLLNALPEHARGASSLSRHFSLDRATCQRIVSTAAERAASAALLVKLPGVRGLKQFVQAFRDHPGSAEEAMLAGADAAVDQYQTLLTELGGSQSRLATRLAASDAAAARGGGVEGPVARGVRERETMFRAAAQITRRVIEFIPTIYAMRARPPEGGAVYGRVDTIAATGVIGHMAGPDAVPLSFLFGAGAAMGEEPDEAMQYVSLEGTPSRGRSPRSVLAPFSSDPLPLVTSRGPKGMLLQLIDAKVGAERPLDVVLANRNTSGLPHPATENPPMHEFWALMHHPCRRMVMDVWLHRDLARMCIPGADAHLVDPNFEAFMGQRWHTRFPAQPHGPRLEVLGSGLGNAPHPAYARHAELTSFVFEQVEWEPGEFVGFRVDVEYPVWRAGYCTWFDFTQNTERAT